MKLYDDVSNTLNTINGLKNVNFGKEQELQSYYEDKQKLENYFYKHPE